MFNSKNAFYLFILTIGYVGIASAQSSNAIKNTQLLKQEAPQIKKPQTQFCPKREDLFKQGVYWTTKDGKWRNYTYSSADKIINFIGAQWAGIRVGKVICLYYTNEAVSFPLAIEQVTSQGTSEPSGLGWSSLSGNHRFCKSASIADCGFYYEAPKDLGNLYDEIKYNPRAAEAS